MPDFDTFERIFKSAVSGDIPIDLAANNIFELPEINKVQVVKSKSLSELEQFLVRAESSLRSFFPEPTSFTSNDNNKDGKDLFERHTRTQIELKSGAAMTDANSGLSIVSWALEDSELKIESIMKGGMTKRRNLILAGANSDQINASKHQTMDELAVFLSGKVNIGPAPERLSHYFKSVAVGLTKSIEIQKAFKSIGPSKTPLLLEANWSEGLTLYEKAFLPDESIFVTKIERTKDRAQLIATGEITGRTAKLYPNYKNSWKLPNGQRIPASNWVESACFHVWIDK